MNDIKQKKKLLVVGAGGFIGGFIARKSLELGYETYVAVRESTSRRYLDDERLKFVVLDYDDEQSLAARLRDALPEGERWDYIIYNLGATKCVNFLDFNRINYEYLKVFSGALHQTGKVPEKMLYMSSLSVVGPHGERNYEPYTEDIIPHPNTRYGASKLKAELWLATAGIPCIIFRATGIYGPWDKDYFLMFESIRKGFDFGVGFRKQMLTFIYADDLASAAYDALREAPVGEIYNIAEPRAYSQKEFRRLAMKYLSKKFVMPVRMPLWAVKAVCAVSEKIGALRVKPSTLNRDKFRILKQRNWNCSVDKARRDFGFEVRTPLEEGVRKTIEWYRKEGWIK